MVVHGGSDASWSHVWSINANFRLDRTLPVAITQYETGVLFGNFCTCHVPYV